MVKALWEGTPGAGGGRGDPLSLSNRKCSLGGGTRACQRDSRADGQTDAKPASSPPARASEPNPTCPTAHPAPACPRNAKSFPEPKWFRPGAVPSLFPGVSVPLWTPRPGEAGEVQDGARMPLPLSQRPFLSQALHPARNREPGAQSDWASACPGGRRVAQHRRSGFTQRQAPLDLRSPSPPQSRVPSCLPLPVFGACLELGAGPGTGGTPGLGPSGCCGPTPLAKVPCPGREGQSRPTHCPLPRTACGGSRAS